MLTKLKKNSQETSRNNVRTGYGFGAKAQDSDQDSSCGIGDRPHSSTLSPISTIPTL